MLCKTPGSIQILEITYLNYSMLFTAPIAKCKFIYFVLYAFIYHNTRTHI